MVDTVVLMHPFNLADAAKVINPKIYDEWSPSLNGILNPPYIKLGRNGSVKSVLNLSNKVAGVYAPKLTLYKRVVQGGFKCFLYIEFSAPKLLFGNNFEELIDNELDDVCFRLGMVLHTRGIYLADNVLKNCTVKAIHYSKNIVFGDGLMPSTVIRYLSKAKMPATEHEWQTSFVNGGEALYGSPKAAKNFCAYNKKSELRKAKRSEKGNLETESWCQFDMLDKFNDKEILRLELRLNNKKAIRYELDKMQITYSRQELPFCELFSAEISQKLLCERIDYMENHMPKLLMQNSDYDSFLEQLTGLNPRARPNAKLVAYAFHALSQQGLSMRQIRQQLKVTNQQWAYLTKNLEKLKVPDAKFNPLDEVKKQLSEFQPIRLEDNK